MKKNSKIPKKKWFNLSTKKIIYLLKNKLIFSEVNNSISQKSAGININFANSLYGVNVKYRFPYNNDVAETVLIEASYYLNLFDLIANNFFDGELNLFKTFDEFMEVIGFSSFEENFFENSLYAASNLSKEEYFDTLTVSKWSYEDFVVSAAFFHAETIYNKAYRTKSMYMVQDLYFIEFRSFARYLFPLFFHKVCGEGLFKQ